VILTKVKREKEKEKEKSFWFPPKTKTLYLKK
jgi:hypothetical protein